MADDPTFARVHIFDANELQRRFYRAHAARRGAGHTIPLGRGVWVALYENKISDPVTLVGAGVGMVRPPIARVPLAGVGAPTSAPPPAAAAQRAGAGDADDGPLSIAEAKERLARTLGVDPANIRITVEA